MTLSLSPKLCSLIERKVRRGEYARPEDVIRAALGSLIADESFGDFEPGELDRLLAEGEASIRRGGTLDGDTALRRRRERRARHRSKSA